MILTLGFLRDNEVGGCFECFVRDLVPVEFRADYIVDVVRDVFCEEGCLHCITELGKN